MVDPSHSFHIADYAVFAITIMVSIGIGIFYALSGDRQRTTSEYLVGGRSMKVLPVAISLMVSFESSIMMLGLPAEMYVYGAQWWLSCIGHLISHFLSIFIMVPLLHPLKLTSAYEYLQYRYNSTAVRLLGSFLGMLTYTWYMGIVLFGPAIALEAVTGFSQWSSIFVVSFVAVIYTSVGGLKAVIWTDVFQALIMYAGMFAILIKGSLDVGGAKKVWDVATAGGRLDFFNFDPDPRTRHTFWNLFFGSIIRGFGLAFNQSSVQRVSSTKTRREATLMMLVTAPCFFLSLTAACYEGIVAYAYYQTIGCDPLASKKISNPNQVIPFMVMDIFKSLPGMPGLFLASLFSASLSTLSSGLSSLSALLWADYIKPRFGEVSEFKATIIAKFSVLVFGLLGSGIAMLVSLIGGPLVQISTSLLSAFAGPLTGMFLMGAFFPWVNAKGAFIGGVLSLIYTSWLSLGMSFSKSVKKQPWLPAASTDMCLANETLALFNTTGSSLDVAHYGISSMQNQSHHYHDTMYYSTVAASVMETTTELMEEEGPQGIEAMYTLSYQWLGPVSILLTLLLGSVISLLTGCNKDREVDPRFMISFCDHVCCCLPESVKKRFRWGKDYAMVKGQDPPLHDVFMDKEIIIMAPDEDAQEETETIAVETEIDQHKLGNDVKPDPVQALDQNGDTFSTHTATEANGDVYKQHKEIQKETCEHDDKGEDIQKEASEHDDKGEEIQKETSEHDDKGEEIQKETNEHDDKGEESKKETSEHDDKGEEIQKETNEHDDKGEEIQKETSEHVDKEEGNDDNADISADSHETKPLVEGINENK